MSGRLCLLILCFQAIITLILATDMARHSEVLECFKQKLDIFDFTSEEHVTCVRKHLAKSTPSTVYYILHC